MKLNKKGMTLVEIIISVALLSVVLGFLFKVLLDVKYESDDSGFAITNQINRAEITKEIQNDLIESGGASAVSVNSGLNKVAFTINSEVKLLEIIDDNILKYDNKKWTIKDKNYEFGEIVMTTIDNCYFKINIPVISYYENNEIDASIDDIEIFSKYNYCNLE